MADEQVLAREGVQRILEAAPEVEVVATVGNARGLREAVERGRPDVVVVDARVSPACEGEGLEIAEMLDARYPGIGLLVLSDHSDPRSAFALFRGGVTGRGYLLKHRLVDAGEFAHSVCAIARGGTLVDPVVIEAFVAARSRADRSPLRSLTQRERATLNELARGKSNQAIATALGVTRRAVEHQIQSIFTKLELDDDPDTSRRVRATLLFLAEQEPHAQRGADGDRIRILRGEHPQSG